MVVTAAQVQGSVGGGRLEQRAIGIARELLVADAPSPRLERFALGASLGQCCGGVVVLAFERVGPAQREWVGRAATLAAGGHAWGRQVFIDGPRAGEVAVFDGASVEHACTDPALSAHARDLLAAGEDTALLLFMLGCRSDASRDRADEGATAPGSAAPPAPSAGSRLASLLQEDLAAPRRSDASRDRADGSATAPGSAAALGTAILLDASPPPALQVVMFGAGHVGRALAELFGRLPLRVRWVDARAQEFPPALAPNVEPHCTDTPTAEVRAAPAGAVFLVLTHSHALDFELVEAILARDDFRFCGLIGSQTKRARFAHRLHARGIEEARIARLRKDEGITQVQLAEQLGTSQQTITAYEVGRRRVPVSSLPRIAKLLGVSVEELIGEDPKPAKRGPAPKLQQQLERITRLPKTQQRFVMQVIDSVIAQANR